VNVRMMHGWRRFRLGDLSAEPWRNGGGITRTIAAGSEQGEVRWRVSVAEITRDGPFSRFAGIERSAMLVSGNGVVLRGPAAGLNLPRCGDMAGFPGDVACEASLIDGPVRLLNVMTARDAASCVLACRHDVPLAAGGPPQVVLVLSGGYRMSIGGMPADGLQPGDGIVIERDAPQLAMTPEGPDSRVALVCIRPAVDATASPISSLGE
jgi:environmental stress-induced protein Ves